MHTVRAMLLLGAAVLQSTACSIECNKECQRGKRVAQQARHTLECNAAGETLLVTDLLKPVSSCDSVLRDISYDSSSICEFASFGEGEVKVSCSSKGPCTVVWSMASETCLCGGDADAPELCDEKCTAYPQCSQHEEVSLEACEAGEMGCRADVSCCVEAVCRAKKTPTPAPKTPAPEPSTPCGTTTPECSAECNLGKTIIKQVKQNFECTAVDQKLSPTSPLKPGNCDSVLKDISRETSEVCEFESVNRDQVRCSSEGPCTVVWSLAVDACLCGDSANAHCDAQCTAYPQCAQDEEISAEPCKPEETGCRTDTICCVEAVCRRASQDPPAPAQNCVSECGRHIAHASSGLIDDGDNYCNTCTCLNGVLSCTAAYCKPRSPKCLAKHSVCRLSIGGSLTVDRVTECPSGTHCVTMLGSEPLESRCL